MAYLYRHVRLDTNKVFYVGIGSDLNYSRAHRKTTRNKFWNRIVEKTNYRVDIVLDNLSWEEARIKEIEFISIYGRRDIGIGTLVNLTDGGDGCVNRKFTDKQYESSRKFKTQEWRDRIAKSNKGKLVSNKTRKKISESRKGKSLSYEVRCKISASLSRENHPNWGKKLSYQTRKKMSDSAFNMSDERKRKISESRMKWILDTSNGIYYLGSLDACKSINVTQSYLNNMLSGINRNKTSMIYV
jgi:hypothetical protein